MPDPEIPWQLEQLPANSCAPSCALGFEGSVVGRTIPDCGWAWAIATAPRANTAATARIRARKLMNRRRLR